MRKHEKHEAAKKHDKEHKRARGGSMPGMEGEAEKQAEHHAPRKRGGHVPGKKSEHRPDRRARGGAAEAHPFSSAGKMSKMPFETKQDRVDTGGKEPERD